MMDTYQLMVGGNAFYIDARFIGNGLNKWKVPPKS
jgi:hypothetical protein